MTANAGSGCVAPPNTPALEDKRTASIGHNGGPPLDDVQRTDDVLLVTVPRAARMLSISTAQMYNLLARREVASVKIGKSRRLEPAELRRLVAARRQAANTCEQAPT
jgi:hypothetical protein